MTTSVVFRWSYVTKEKVLYCFYKIFLKKSANLKFQVALGRQVLLIVNPHLSLAKNRNFITLLFAGGYSSVVEHSTADREITGSTPVAHFSFVSLFFSCLCAWLEKWSANWFSALFSILVDAVFYFINIMYSLFTTLRLLFSFMNLTERQPNNLVKHNRSLTEGIKWYKMRGWSRSKECFFPKFMSTKLSVSGN